MSHPNFQFKQEMHQHRKKNSVHQVISRDLYQLIIGLYIVANCKAQVAKWHTIMPEMLPYFMVNISQSEQQMDISNTIV